MANLKSDQIPKVYWQIGEVAKELGVKVSHVRFYCREFNLPVSHKGNKRMFSLRQKEHIENAVLAAEYFNLKTIKEHRLWANREALRKLVKILEPLHRYNYEYRKAYSEI